MALDNAAAQNAQSLLNGIDYGALIGGPLTAAIKAQAMAARSTWEFIQEVGLNTDKDGNKSAVNVTFMYQKDGEMVRLIVPILTIVPIPLIIIDEVDIQFKANINASASQSTEQTESSAMAGELTATGSIGWGPFSLSATVKASYSSKKDSKATQDSKYSVEYTQDVHVHASQAGMPAGLATVLNILSNASGTGSRDGLVKASPSFGTLSLTDPTQKQNMQVNVVDPNGLGIPGAPVTIDKIPAWLSFGLAPLGVVPSGQAPTITVPADDKGNLSLQFWIKEEHQKTASTDPFQLVVTAAIGKANKTAVFPLKVVGALPPATVTITPPGPIPITKGTAKPVTFKASSGGSLPSNARISAAWDVGDVTVMSGGNAYVSGTQVPLVEAGLALDITAKTSLTTQHFTVTVTVVNSAGATLGTQPIVFDVS
jgi:hypothetical protein